MNVILVYSKPFLKCMLMFIVCFTFGFLAFSRGFFFVFFEFDENYIDTHFQIPELSVCLPQISSCDLIFNQATYYEYLLIFS